MQRLTTIIWLRQTLLEQQAVHHATGLSFSLCVAFCLFLACLRFKISDEMHDSMNNKMQMIKMGLGQKRQKPLFICPAESRLSLDGNLIEDVQRTNKN